MYNFEGSNRWRKRLLCINFSKGVITKRSMPDSGAQKKQGWFTGPAVTQNLLLYFQEAVINCDAAVFFFCCVNQTATKKEIVKYSTMA